MPSAMLAVVGFSHSGPANPSTPEPGPNSRLKISPVSSNTIAESPSGAAGKRYGKKLSTVTSSGNAAPCR